MSNTPNPQRAKRWWNTPTPANMTALAIIVFAIIVALVSIITGNTPMFWIGGVLLASMGVASGLLLHLMGYGTQWASPSRKPQ